jgi:hypothetical protein
MEISPQAKGLAPVFAGFAEEGFLLTLTNKGTYNRALKDYEALAGLIALSEENGDLAVSFEDTKVLLKQPVKGSRCSCPARDTCKHILIALFAARDAGIGNAAESQSSENFDELENAGLEALKREAGEKNYREALRRFLDGYGAVFPENVFFDKDTKPSAVSSAGPANAGEGSPPEMLAAEVKGDGVTVYFPRKKSITGAVCKCGVKGLCVHTLVAVFSYLEKRCLPAAAGLEEDEEEELGAAATTLLEQAMGFAGSLFEKGLISADETDIEAAQQFSLKFEGLGIGNLSRLFRGLATDLGNMLSKNSGFNHRVSFGSLSRIFNTSFLILKHRDDRGKQKALIEKSRAAYRSIPQGHFIGLGAYPWQTRSGYAGVSCLFYSKERDAVFNYSDSMADFYEKTRDAASIAHLKAAYKRVDHWNPQVSIEIISTETFLLKPFKLNDDLRVSSSKETTYLSEGKTTGENCAAIAASPAFRAGDETSYDYFGKRNRSRYTLVWTERIENCFYDRVQQLLKFTLCGEEDDSQAVIPYSEINKKAIDYIENLAKLTAVKQTTVKLTTVSMTTAISPGEFTPRWFVCQRDRRGLIPLSAIDADGVRNFYF